MIPVELTISVAGCLAPEAVPPTALVVETFRGCNMRCPHCNVPFTGNTDGNSIGAMTLDTFRALQSVLERAHVVGYDNMGEPTLNPWLAEFIQLQKTWAPHSKARMTSNLLRLTRQTAYRLLSAGLDQLQLSIDGATASTFQAHRAGATLETTVRKTRLLGQVKRDLGLDGFELVCCFVAKEDNIDELPDVARLVSTLDVTTLYVNGMEPYREADVQRALWNDDARRAKAQAVFDLVSQVNHEEGLGLDLCLPALRPTRNVGCALPIDTMAINYDGSVSPCFVAGMATSVFDEDRCELTRTPVTFGNVRQEDPLAIWAKPAYVSFRSRATSATESQRPSVCTTCWRPSGVICTSPTTPDYIQRSPISAAVEGE